MSTPKTIPLYYSSSEKLECQSTVQLVQEASGYKQPNCHFVVLDQTVCYPQGGGQPSDTGKIIKDGTNQFEILDARMDKDTNCIQHIGKFCGHLFAVGDTVTVQIDEDKRVLHSRLHTAGHVIDACLHTLGYKWNATKGFHFPSGPYVEYKGEVADSQIEEIKNQLQQKARQLIEEDIAVKIHLDVTQEEAKSMCGELDPMYLLSPSLLLISIGSFACPCGGTHVQRLSQLKGVEVPKIKATRGKQLIRVQYKLVN